MRGRSALTLWFKEAENENPKLLLLQPPLLPESYCYADAGTFTLVYGDSRSTTVLLLKALPVLVLPEAGGAALDSHV